MSVYFRTLRMSIFSFVTLVVLILLSSSEVLARQPFVINIDNPNFRKLVAAVPKFATEGRADAATIGLADRGAKELSSLLSFSGVFNVMSKNAYSGAAKSLAGVKPSGARKQLEGIDQVQWKSLGVESLTVGELKKTGSTYELSLRTIDIYRGKLVIGKKYSKVKPAQFSRVLKRYADQILKAYTGREGIFSSKLVFAGRKAKNSYKQIYMSDIDGKNVVQITRDRAPHLSPAWSRDGRYITYTSYRDGNPDLFMYDTKTQKRSKLSGRKGLNSGSNWAFNNKLIAFTGSRAGDADIFVINPTSPGKPKPLIRGAGLDVDPRFSPDGRYLAFVSGRFGNPHIFLATLKWASSTSVRVTGDKRLTYAGWYNATPSWSPDSDKLAFAGYDRDTDRFDLFMVDPSGKNLERLTIRAGDNERPDWSPNGQMLVFQSNRTKGRDVKGTHQLFMMNRDGSGQRQIYTGLYESQTPDWGPADPK